MLKEIGETSRKTRGTSTLAASDFMDDGTLINLKIEVNVEEVSHFYEALGY